MQNAPVPELPEELAQQVCLIDKSQGYLIIVIAATILSYYTVSIQKQQLICTATDEEICKLLPPTLPIQAVTSILFIVSLVFFYGLTEDNVRQTKPGTKQHARNQLNHLSSILVLMAAIIRFALLLQNDTELDT